jgi:hypothetical protein
MEGIIVKLIMKCDSQNDGQAVGILRDSENDPQKVTK